MHGIFLSCKNISQERSRHIDPWANYSVKEAFLVFSWCVLAFVLSYCMGRVYQQYSSIDQMEGLKRPAALNYSYFTSLGTIIHSLYASFSCACAHLYERFVVDAACGLPAHR